MFFKTIYFEKQKFKNKLNKYMFNELKISTMMISFAFYGHAV